MKKPHAVCVPFPLQGHINPMFKLAKLLHHKGFYITFVNTEFNHKRLLKSRGVESFDGFDSFRFVTIDDGLSPSEHENAPDFITLFHSTDKSSRAPFTELIAKHANGNDDDDVPKVSCIVADEIMSFTTYAAQEFDLPLVILSCHNAFLNLFYTQTGVLYEKGYLPLKDENLENHIKIEDIPVLKGMPLRCIPRLIANSDPRAMAMLLKIQQTSELWTDCENILNTFEELEGDSLKALASVRPSIKTIGPLHLLEELVADNKDMQELESSLWKEEPECLEWLDSKEPNSVMYVNFGSISTLTPEQLNELAWGLANSNHNFLWIIRPDLVKSGGGSGAVGLQPDFFESTKERGMVATWCKQEKVLKHPSIGGFITHNGWNSTLESICCGVPMICLPFTHDQLTNCWNVCEQWGIGFEITDVKRDVVERLLCELLSGDKGKEMKKKAMEWKNKAHDSAKTTSLKNLEKLVDRLMILGNPGSKN